MTYRTIQRTLLSSARILCQNHTWPVSIYEKLYRETVPANKLLRLLLTRDVLAEYMRQSILTFFGFKLEKPSEALQILTKATRSNKSHNNSYLYLVLNGISLKCRIWEYNDKVREDHIPSNVGIVLQNKTLCLQATRLGNQNGL